MTNISESKFEINAESKGCKVLRGGWPDYAVIGPDGALFCVEVKAGNSLSEAQKEMIHFLTLAGIPCYVSWNGNFPDLNEPFDDSNKSMNVPNFEELTEDYKIAIKRVVERDYHHRLEITEEKLRQIKKICEDYQ